MRGINLLPWREQKREEQKRYFLTLLGISAFSVFLIIFFIHIWVASDIEKQVAVNDYFKQQIAVLDKKIQQIKELQSEKKKLLARMNLIFTLQQQRPEIVHLFEGIVKVTPKGIFITNVSRTNNLIKITGQAQSNSEISVMLKNIDDFPWFTKAVLNEIKNDDKDTSYSKTFELQFSERNGVPPSP